jgi:hypothetical protein
MENRHRKRASAWRREKSGEIMAAASAIEIMAANEKVAMAKKTAAAKNKSAENNVKNGVSMAAKIMKLERRIKSSQHEIISWRNNIGGSVSAKRENNRGVKEISEKHQNNSENISENEISGESKMAISKKE